MERLYSHDGHLIAEAVSLEKNLLVAVKKTT
jgi:hypothetical protein